jgi:hypothetical protein
VLPETSEDEATTVVNARSRPNYPHRFLKDSRIRRFMKDTRINDPGPGACQLPATVHLLASENQLVTALCDTGVPRTDQESPG